MKTTTIKLNSRLYDALDKRAQEIGVSKVAILRLALERYLGMERQRHDS